MLGPLPFAERLKAKLILFSDFDGTITLQDSNDYMTDKLGFGEKERLVIDDKIFNGVLNFRDGFRIMLGSITSPFDECIKFLVDNVQLDPGFIAAHKWCTENDIPVVIVSSGMVPVIKLLLNKLIGEKESENIDIIANDVKILDNGKWEIVYRHEDSGFGHDKSRSLTPYSSQSPRPIMFYCGDGVSDLSAARETDLLFAKRGKKLIKFCEREGIPYTQFDSFVDILEKIKLVVRGDNKVEDFNENSNK